MQHELVPCYIICLHQFAIPLNTGLTVIFITINVFYKNTLIIDQRGSTFLYTSTLCTPCTLEMSEAKSLMLIKHYVFVSISH